MSTTLPGIRVTAECDLDWFCKADKEGVEAGGDASEAQPVTLPTEPELSGPTPDLSTASSFGYFRSIKVTFSSAHVDESKFHKKKVIALFRLMTHLKL